MKSQKMPGKWWRLLPPISWMGIIFLLSGESFSSLHTSRFLTPILHALWPNLSFEVLIQIHAFLRKAGHFLEYFLLSYLWYWSLYPHWGTANRPSSMALAFSLAYAFFDEIHQSLLPSRTASLGDIFIDGTGATLMQAILWFRPRREETPVGARRIDEKGEIGL